MPSFAQCSGDQSGCDDPLYDGEVIVIGHQPDPFDDPFDDPFFDPPENDPCEYDCGDGGGGDPDPEPTPAKIDYCQAVEDVTSLLSGMRIVSSGSSILSLGGIAGGFGLNTLSAGIRDIDYYFSTGMHAPPVYGDAAAINWNRANTVWGKFESSWNALGLGLGSPTRSNGGAEHIMALYFQHLGIGSGPNNATPPSSLLPTDPQPGVSC